MRLRLRNLSYHSHDDDYYNPIDLNHIFHDDDILEEWVRENEPPIMPEDNLDWLDEEIHRSEGERHEHSVDNSDDIGNIPLSQFVAGKHKKVVGESSKQKNKDKAKSGGKSKDKIFSFMSKRKTVSSTSSDTNEKNKQGSDSSSSTMALMKRIKEE